MSRKLYSKEISKNLFLVLLILIIETFVLKITIYHFLPQKYFYDANHILEVMRGSKLTDVSYSYVAGIFNTVNIFNFTTIFQWGALIALIITPIILIILTKNKKYSLSQYFFIISSFTLLNIYVFGISKDIVQFVYFLIIYLVLSNNKLSNIKKITIISGVLLFEAISFRIYYALMAMLIVTIYFIYKKFIYNKKISKKQFIKIISLSLAAFFLEIFIVQILSTQNYNSIINARLSVNIQRIGSVDASTIVNDPLGPNNNFFIFIGNYLINAIRFLFPIELLTKGPLQMVFCLYQIYISVSLIRSCNKINNRNCLWIFTVISFLMISFIFEPDFGSFVRHESALFLIIIEITNLSICRKEAKAIYGISDKYIVQYNNTNIGENHHG